MAIIIIIVYSYESSEVSDDYLDLLQSCEVQEDSYTNSEKVSIFVILKNNEGKWLGAILCVSHSEVIVCFLRPATEGLILSRCWSP